jgi:hypothetical protein
MFAASTTIVGPAQHANPAKINVAATSGDRCGCGMAFLPASLRPFSGICCGSESLFSFKLVHVCKEMKDGTKFV